MGAWREWLTTLWQQDRGTVWRLVVVGALGLALAAWGSLSWGGAAAPPDPPAAPAANSALSREEGVMDRQLRAILERVPGAGRVWVAVTLSRSARAQYGRGAAPLAEWGPAVAGVVVVADGAAAPFVRQELESAVETLLQVAAYRVLVLPQGGG
jgi:hypothetical protein